MALGNPEIRQRSVDLETQALMEDCRVREIDKIVRESWSELAALATRFRDKKLWAELPPRMLPDESGEFVMRCFHSFDEWLLDACPCCRATVYKGMGILSVLAKDLALEDISQIEIGNASILAYEVSTSNVRRDPEVLAAAKGARHSRALREIVKKKFPDQLMEDVHVEKLQWPTSAWIVIEEAFAAYRAFEDETISFSAWIEWRANDYMDSPHAANPSITNRQAWRAR